MATGKALDGKPYAGNPHVRFDEGEVAPAAKPRRGSLLYKMKRSNVVLAAFAVFAAMSSAVLKLKAEDPIKWKNLSLGAESELFQLDRDYTVDGLHLADWGMMNVGKAFAKEFLKALGK